MRECHASIREGRERGWCSREDPATERYCSKLAILENTNSGHLSAGVYV